MPMSWQPPTSSPAIRTSGNASFQSIVFIGFSSAWGSRAISLAAPRYTRAVPGWMPPDGSSAVLWWRGVRQRDLTMTPKEPHAPPPDDADPGAAGFLQVLGAVFSSFFGVRKKASGERDMVSIKP